MDHQSSSIKFALIGHQDSWEHVIQFVNNIRFTNENDLLCEEKIKDVFSFIPPRKLFDITVNSSSIGAVKGFYVDTFISPDELDIKHLQKNIEKVKEACTLSSKLGASIVSLGGFTSIVLEAGKSALTNINGTSFTTGNSLTAAFIAKGVEQACGLWNQPLRESNLLLIGSTGDIGSACVEYFSGKVNQLLLCARQPGPLLKQSKKLHEKGISNIASSSLKDLIPVADIIICVASSVIENNDLENLQPLCIVCDAGYPKNLQHAYLKDHERLFYGGMGVVKQGFQFENNADKNLYNFCIPNVSHGCLLEGIVLAMENKLCAYSSGRGNITASSMNEILLLAAKHGIVPAPLFNEKAVIQPHQEKMYV